MSQDVIKGPSQRALKIILTNVVLYTYRQRSFQWAKFEAKRFFDAKRVSYLNVPSFHPPPPPPQVQTNKPTDPLSH